MKTDSEIQQDVLDELAWDTRVSETEVGVEVDRGVVTLSGRVDSWAKRMAAQQAAHRVAGVLDVANEIEVHVPGTGERTDPEIARAIRLALEWDELVPDESIHTTVSKGRVVLEGSVKTLAESEDAERAVRNLTGVKGVTNKIQIKPPPLQANDLRDAIERALERHAEREAERVKVNVDGGHVTLAGVVHSWAERRAVVGAARGTRGVRSVTSEKLRVEPYA